MTTTVIGVYALLEMTTAAACVGFKGVKLQEIKSDSLIRFERIFLFAAILAWSGVYLFEVTELSKWDWSPIVVNVLTAISIGIIIKFLDIEWTLMGDDAEKDKWGIFSLGALISIVSALALVKMDTSLVWKISSAKITLSLGVSLLFAISSRIIDSKIDLSSIKVAP